MFKLFEACNGCFFHFLSSLIKAFLVSTVSSSHYLKFSLPTSLTCLHNFSVMFLVKMRVYRTNEKPLQYCTKYCFSNIALAQSSNSIECLLHHTLICLFAWFFSSFAKR